MHFKSRFPVYTEVILVLLSRWESILKLVKLRKEGEGESKSRQISRKTLPPKFSGVWGEMSVAFPSSIVFIFSGGAWLRSEAKARKGEETRVSIDRQMINSAQFVRASMYKGAFRKSKCKKNKTSQFFKVERAQMNPRTFLGACTRLLVQIPRLWNAQE